MKIVCRLLISMFRSSPVWSAYSRDQMPKWLREFLVSVGVIAITLTIFAVAIALGFFVSIKLAQGSFWMGVAVAISFLVFVVLPLRLWWVSRKARQS